MRLPRPDALVTLSRGATATVTGHFGEWLQGRLGQDGPVVLRTLPCPASWVTATWLGHDRLRVSGAPVLTAPQMRRFLAYLTPQIRAHIRFSSSAPLGGGAGASTAARLALARLLRPQLTAQNLARLCLMSEGASDPLMFEHPGDLLWASRQGRLVRRFPPAPPIRVVGGFWKFSERTKASDMRFADVADLVKTWSHGPSVEVAAQLASESARRNLALRGPNNDPIETLCKDATALGFATAHTGSARALLFPGGHDTQRAKGLLREAGYSHVIEFETGTSRWTPLSQC